MVSASKLTRAEQNAKAFVPYMEKIEENWLITVKPEDTVVLAGDTSWGMSLEQSLPDFKFIDNSNDTYTGTEWKGTLNGIPSTELVIPNNKRIIL